MADIRSVERLVGDRKETTYQGTVVLSGGALAVNVAGNILPARWADPLVVAAGDPVLVQIGQGEAFVRARLTDRPRPGRGTVATVPPSSPTITVTGSDGQSYTATFVGSYTPTVGDAVLLSWNAAVPTVQGKITTTPAPPPPPPPVAPPPAAPTTGVATYVATDSDSFWGPGGWGSWAGGGGRVFQGNIGSGEVFGAWFYAGSPGQLAGRTITRIRFVLGSRQAVGSYNAPVTVHFYAHTSANKPGGDVARVVGPYDVTAQPGQGLTQYDLPLSFATALQGGGGIAIAFNPYAAFAGRNTQPESGKLTMDWSM